MSSSVASSALVSSSGGNIDFGSNGSRVIGVAANCADGDDGVHGGKRTLCANRTHFDFIVFHHGGNNNTQLLGALYDGLGRWLVGLFCCGIAMLA